MQAVGSIYMPRVAIERTSSSARGQIYIPWINWGLMLACIDLVLELSLVRQPAAAYGIAVVLTMIITTCGFYFTARRLWQWSLIPTGALCAVFVAAELLLSRREPGSRSNTAAGFRSPSA